MNHVWIRTPVGPFKNPAVWRSVRGMKAWRCRFCDRQMVSVEKPKSNGRFMVVVMVIEVVTGRGRVLHRRDRFTNAVHSSCYAEFVRRTMER